MKKWIYWDNSKVWHNKIIVVVYADGITEADEIFKSITKIDPRKQSFIGACPTECIDDSPRLPGV